ncbi:hypothetical protein LI328DRAFT_158547 [Trichoderma asperelloides]|nr:hypothetical protein LI328DRAFT_158547 [Trichoderma asperelloides]
MDHSPKATSLFVLITAWRRYTVCVYSVLCVSETSLFLTNNRIAHKHMYHDLQSTRLHSIRNISAKSRARKPLLCDAAVG